PRSRWRSPAERLRHEPLPVYQRALDPPLRHGLLPGADPDLEQQPGTVHLGEGGVGAHGGADRAGCAVLELHPGADGGRTGRQLRRGGGHRGGLGEREHPGGSQGRHVARPQRLGGVGIGDGQLHLGGEPGGDAAGKLLLHEISVGARSPGSHPSAPLARRLPARDYCVRMATDTVKPSLSAPDTAVAPPGPPRRRYRVVAMAVWGTAFVACWVTIGLPTEPVYMFGWLWTVTIAWRIHLPVRQHLTFLRD